MPWIARHPVTFLAKVVLLFALVGLTLAAPRACDGGRQVVPAMVSSPPSAIVLFDRDEVDADVDTVPSLAAVAERAWSDLAVRVLITGAANERRSLVDNLALAEKRARFVADALVSRGVPRRQLVIAAVESSPDDPAGARCHVEIVDPREAAPPTS